jgi:hypothetical protein
VILLDVNVLVAAHRADHPQHDGVRPWFDELTSGDEPFSVPDVVWAGFVRISTNRRIFRPPTPLDGAFAFLNAIRAQRAYIATEPGPRRLGLFELVCTGAEAAGDLAADAYLAALAIEQGATLVSMDRDFARFPDLRWRLPGQK